MSAVTSEREAFRLHLIQTEGINVTGHPDGCCIRFGGDVVEIFPTFIGAACGKVAAEDALVMLTETLGRTAQ